MRAAVSVEAHTCLLRYHLTSKIKQAAAAIGQRAITIRIGQGSKSQPSCAQSIGATPEAAYKLAAQATRPGGTGR